MLLPDSLVAFCRSVVLVAMALSATLSIQAQIVINGVVDRTTYTDSATFQVVGAAGFTDEVTLNGKPLSSGVSYTVRTMDYYDLVVRRTETATENVTTALVRFIVLSSNRGSPERGLIQWVPHPPTASGSEEFAGAILELIAPSSYPASLDIPIITRTWEPTGESRRVNGWVTAPGFENSTFRVVRGVGFGFLPGAASGTLAFNGTLGTLNANQQITIEAAPAWTTVSGILGTSTTWPANSRIRVTGNLTIEAGSTLTIGEGTVVWLNPGVNITNSGRTEINGTANAPVVFTAGTRVAPEQRTGAWGGWLLRGAAASLTATHTIMTGSGAASSFSFSPGSSHRSEQPLLFVHSGATVRMTNCALINNAGQIGNGYYSTITWDRCLLQRAITTGEYEGCTNVITHSAVIEFPSIDGVYNAQIADADYDGIYMIGGTNYFAHSLFGFAKDDAIDSGSGGPGSVQVTNCWVESALHEAFAWSGEGRRTWSYATVLMNSGQGFECGWSTGSDSPLCWGERLLSVGNSVGVRYGDNYEGTSGLGLKTGFQWLTNSIVLHNYRDVWGQVWDDTWNYRVGRMDIRDNYLTAANTNHPNNSVWNPSTDASRLDAFMATPPSAAVGVGFANWNPLTTADLTNGVPLRLSTFTSRRVTVDYSVETPAGPLASGTVTFEPGEMLKKITALINTLGAQDLVRVSLRQPVACEITSARDILIVPGGSVSPTNQTLIALSSPDWKFLDRGQDQGIAWRAPAFNDAGWSNGCAQLGYGDNDECKSVGFGPSSSAKYPTTYFRKAITVASPSQFTSLSLRVIRDDGAVVYINGTEVLRSPTLPQPPTQITYATLATNLSIANAPADNTVDQATLNSSVLSSGLNVIAAEVHQHRGDSSDISFDLELNGNLPPQAARLNGARFGSDLVLYWGDTTYRLEFSNELGQDANWAPAINAATPYVVVPAAAQRFYRLRKP